MSKSWPACCQHAGLVNAFVQSPRAYTDWIGQRYFRGAMPPTLRSNLEQRIRLGSWDAQQPDKGALQLLEYSLFTPYFGVLK